MRLLWSGAMPAAPRPMPAPALLADIGGTHARFALAGPGATRALLDDSLRTYPVERFDTLAASVRHYLDEVGTTPRRAVIGLAGRIEGDTARMTNHRWVVSAERLREALGMASVTLV